MRRAISTTFLAFVCSCSMTRVLHSAEDSLPGEADAQQSSEWEALEAANEEILNWADDPLQDLDVFKPSNLFWTTSVSLGAGFSDNFLKSEIKEESPFLKFEADFFLNFLFKKSTLTILAYLEGIHYTYETEVSEEALAFLHAGWKPFRPKWSYGIEGDIFFGNQIYDASLIRTAEPEGERIRQIRPEATAFLERTLDKDHKFKLSLSLERVLYERSEDDYWRPRIRLEWDRTWSSSIESSLALGYFEEHYDEEIARDSRGFPFPEDEKLLLRAPFLEGKIIWNPAFWKSLEVSARAGSAQEHDIYGKYEEADRYWASLGLDFEMAKFDFELYGRWQTTRWDTRQVGFLDTRPNRHLYKTVRFEVERSLPWNLRAQAGIEWISFGSRIEEESFSEMRLQALLNWAY